MKAIPYYRVSTARQGVSGLGLEAQRKAVTDYAARYGYELGREFTEIESGKIKMRPVLQKALMQCRKEKAILLIAKLDRLGRNVAFVTALMESLVDFKCVDNPEATRFVLHILAAVAENELEQIKKRTKDALAVAKLRGVVLGKYGRDVLAEKNRKAAVAFAWQMKPVIEALGAEGYTSIRALVAILNERKIRPYTGKKARWHVRSVSMLLTRIKELPP